MRCWPGLGSDLMLASLEEANRQDYQSIWLGVWEKNNRAIVFYERWDFQVIGSHAFVLGSDRQNDRGNGPKGPYRRANLASYRIRMTR